MGATILPFVGTVLQTGKTNRLGSIPAKQAYLDRRTYILTTEYSHNIGIPYSRVKFDYYETDTKSTKPFLTSDRRQVPIITVEEYATYNIIILSLVAPLAS